MIMKTYKKIDLALQLLLIPIFIIITCTNIHSFLFPAYFTVGAIQLISTLVHLITKYQPVSTARKYYNITLLFIAAGTLSFLVPQFAFFYLYFLLFFSPIMAICYFILSWHELLKLNERPLALLK